MTISACPVCGAHEAETLLEVKNTPVACSFVYPDAATARAIPRADLLLVGCRHCGLAYNRNFDDAMLDYSEGYEEAQGYSALFSDFELELCRDLDRRYALAGKHVLEIGCGKGEFLTRLCDATGARGTGFDPAFDPDRRSPHPRVRFVRSNFDADAGAVAADLVCCKMTLEHIPRAGHLLAFMREHTAGAPLFVQVPDAARIFRDAAFWDIYYEHCLYFTGASLTAALAHAGYHVDDVTTVYGDQYLLAHAHPDPAATASAPSAALPWLGFATSVMHSMEHWRDTLTAAAQRGHVAVWGGGSKAVAFLAALELEDLVDHVVDINPYKQGRFLAGCGLPIVAPSALIDAPAHTIVLMNTVYRDEVSAMLNDLDLRPELIPVV